VKATIEVGIKARAEGWRRSSSKDPRAPKAVVPSNCLPPSDQGDLEPPAGATTDQVIVGHNFVARQVDRRRGERLRAFKDLAAHPHFAGLIPPVGALVYLAQ
jgi:hypothetical protein